MSKLHIIREELDTTFKNVPVYSMFVAKYGPDLILYLKLPDNYVYSFNSNSAIHMDCAIRCRLVNSDSIKIEVTL